MEDILASPYFGAKICLCGSTKFKETFIKVAQELTLKGAIVTMPCIFHHADEVTPITDEEKNLLDLVHRMKIKDADLIYVIDQDHYIGKSTKREIEFAEMLNKNILYWSDVRL